MARTMGSHQSHAPKTTTWLTPPPIIDALGGASSFALDPCAGPLWHAHRPWATAQHMNAEADADGLALGWDGRVWLNPPYSANQIGPWLDRLADHGSGAALIFARTETEIFMRSVFGRADGLLFLAGRLHFHYPDAVQHPDACDAAGGHRWEVKPMTDGAKGCALCGVAKANSGAPSVLVAYGQDELARLDAAGLSGQFVPLRFARFLLVGAMDATWREIMLAWVQRQDGPVRVSDAYRFFANHPKAGANPNWRAKVRQTLQLGPFRRVKRGVWAAGDSDAVL